MEQNFTQNEQNQFEKTIFFALLKIYNEFGNVKFFSSVSLDIGVAIAFFLGGTLMPPTLKLRLLGLRSFSQATLSERKTFLYRTPYC